jgi:hypothetical protein
MQHISFEALVNKAKKLKQAGIKWHFHMIGPACIFSRSKEQYEIIVETETAAEVFSSYFSEKPISQTRQMAELAYGPEFLKKEKYDDKEIRGDEKVNKKETFQKIMERARDCQASGAAWHNHHLPPQCSLNPKKGKHCIVFEDEAGGDALYAYYDQDPVEDLAELEKLFFTLE